MCVSCFKTIFSNVAKTFSRKYKSQDCVYSKEQLEELLLTLDKSNVNYNYVKSQINNYEYNCNLFRDKIIKLL